GEQYIDSLIAMEEGKDKKDAVWDVAKLKELKGYIEQASRDNDNARDSFVKRQRSSQAVTGEVCLVTRYEAGPEGRWITFAPDYGCIILRNIPNPHQNGKIPFKIKYSQP